MDWKSVILARFALAAQIYYARSTNNLVESFHGSEDTGSRAQTTIAEGDKHDF
jgi:hypothetical protein